MASNLFRSKVLSAFKNLHRARLQTFKGDTNALNAARNEINENFRKNFDVQDHAKIEELIIVANDAADILRKHVVQFEQIGDNHFKANVTKDTVYVENTMYQDVSEEELLKYKKTRRKNVNCADQKK